MMPSEPTQDALAPPSHIVDLAVEVSGWSPCRSKRGVVIFQGGDVVSHGYNYKPREFACDGSAACKSTCRVEAVHAEQQALLVAGRKAEGAELLHVKTVNGQLVASGGPSCVQCSKLSVACGIAGVWLYHAEGWRRYSMYDFHRLSLLAADPGVGGGLTSAELSAAATACEAQGNIHDKQQNEETNIGLINCTRGRHWHELATKISGVAFRPGVGGGPENRCTKCDQPILEEVLCGDCLYERDGPTSGVGWGSSSPWQPMETAPRAESGRRKVIDVWCVTDDHESAKFYFGATMSGVKDQMLWQGRVSEVYWLDGAWRPATGLRMHGLTVTPVAWMPLPDPPTETK
jgi:deoxycytidylate deaminase